MKDNGIPWFLPELLLWLPLSSCRGIAFRGWPCLAQSHRQLFLRVIQGVVIQAHDMALKGPGVIHHTSASLGYHHVNTDPLISG